MEKNDGFILGTGVNGQVVIKDAMALKIIKLDPLDLCNKYEYSNYRNIDMPPPRNCDLPGPFFKDTEKFIPGINPWRELRILRILNGVDGVVQLKKWLVDDKYLYLYTEIAGYKNLKEWLNEEHTEEELNFIKKQALDIFNKLKIKNIIHFDAKPANFVINADNKITLIDFGWSVCSDFQVCENEKLYIENNKDIDLKTFLLYTEQYFKDT